MLRERILTACAILLVSSLLLTAMPVPVAAGAAPTVLLSEDAEEGTFEEWDARWQRFDLNEASGADYFCRSNHNLHGSAHAIYASRNGQNSHYLIPVTMGDGSTGYTQPWNVNITGIPASAGSPQSEYVMRYDTGQDSVMKKNVVGASSYSKVTLTFWFWSDTGTSDAVQPLNGSEVGYDLLNVLYWTDGGDSSTKRVLWTDTYAEATARTWVHVSVDVPNDVDAIGFEFVSGSEAPEGGDASDAFASSGTKVKDGGMKEGVYIDDIVITGSDAAAGAVPVETSVDDLASVQGSRTFDVHYIVNEPTVPLDHVNLFYRQGTSGDWLQYGGDFTSGTIPFTAEADGVYQFFTLGYDVNGGTEERTGSPDATTVVDTTRPVTTVRLAGTSTADGNYSGPVSFTFSVSEAGSGVNSTYYRVDSSPWIRYDGSEVTLSNGGTHRIEYFSDDRAGNVEAARSTSVTIETSDPVITFLEPSKRFASGNATVTFEVTAATDITELRASLDGGAELAIDPGLRSVTYTDLASGTHRVTVRAMDSGGRWGQNMTSFTIEPSVLPETPARMVLALGSVDPAYKAGDTVHLTWTCTSEGGAIDSFSVLVDGELAATLTGDRTGYDLTGLSAGSHEITVLATGTGGETARESVSITVTAAASDASDPGSMSQGVLVIGAIAVLGVAAAALLIFLRSRRMY